MPRNSELTRRELIGAAIAIPTIIPSGVLAQPGRYLIELASNGGTYTYFVEAILVSEEGWPW